MILATDYDNTLCIDLKVDDKVIDKINKFMQQGNKFVIITGRNFNSIKYEIEKFNIPYDYVIASNGGLIFDNKGNIVFQKNISKNTLEILFNFIKKHIFTYIVYSNGHNIYFETNRNDVRNIEQMKRDFRPKEVLFKNREIVEISFKGINNEDTASISESMRKEVDGLEVICNRNITDVMAKGINKAFGLRKIQEIVHDNKLYCIGDNHNDLGMIKEFNGFGVKNSIKEIYACARKIYDNVGLLIDDLMNGEIQ